jgi:hypothetical protein
MTDINIPALAREHLFVREGLIALENNYREFQCDVQACGGYQKAMHHQPHRVEPSHRAFRAAIEVLVLQIAALLGDSSNDQQGEVSTVLRGYTYNRCGWPSEPKGLDEWRYQSKHSILP